MNTPQLKAPADGTRIKISRRLREDLNCKAPQPVNDAGTAFGYAPVPLVIYQHDPSLGRDQTIVVTVKTTFQWYKNLRQIEQQARPHSAVFGRERARPYVHGIVAAIPLSQEQIDWSLTGSNWAFSAIEPYALDVHGDKMALAGGNYLKLINLKTGEEIQCRHPWLSQPHSAQFSSDGQRILTASTGFDAVLEFYTNSGKCSWEWFAWDHDFNLSMLGHYVVRERRKNDELTARGKKVLLADDPTKFEFGVATRLIPVHLNSARYDQDGRVLVSMFHQGTGVIIHQATGKVEEIVSGLVNPHKLARSRRGGYFISDTRRGQLVLLDKNHRHVETIALPGLPGLERSPLLSEFLQNATELKPDLFVCVDIHRNSLWLVDAQKRKYRGIKFPREWSVHDVVSVSPRYVHRIGGLVGRILGKVEACVTEGGKVIRHFTPDGREVATFQLDGHGRAIGIDVEM